MIVKLLQKFGFDVVDDIADFKSWWSTRLNAMATALNGATLAVAAAWPLVPADWVDHVPKPVLMGLALGVIGTTFTINFAALFARAVKQTPKA